MKHYATCIALLLACLVVGCAGANSPENTPPKDDGKSDDGATHAVRGGPIVIVANGGSGTVSFVDGTSLEELANLPVATGLHPHHFGVSADGRTVLLSAVSQDLGLGHGGAGGHGGHGAPASKSVVYVIDVESRTMRAAVSVPATVHNAAFIPGSNDFLVAMAEHNLIQAYDARTFAPTWSVGVGQSPLEVTPNLAGTLASVANAGDNTVSVVDLATHKVSRTIAVGKTPVAAWRSWNGTMFVSNEADNSVTKLSPDLKTSDSTWSVSGTPGMVLAAPASDEVWVAIESLGVIAVFDAATHAATRTFTAGTKPHGLAFDGLEDRVFVTDEAGNQVLVLSRRTGKLLDQFNTGTGPNGVLWLAHGGDVLPDGGVDKDGGTDGGV